MKNSKRLNLKNILLIVLLNVIGILLLVFLQYLMFAFLPSLNPDVPLHDKRSEALKFAFSQTKIIGFELVIGLTVLFILNKYLTKDLKKAIGIIVFDLIILLFVLSYFINNYVNKFP